MKRVAVIGAGPSGLATVKELRAEGHSVVCFEKAESLGGVFQFRETDGVVWESCRLTSSTELTAFSDFPLSRTGGPHLRISDYVEYLMRYAEAFDVLPHIRFNTTVEAVRRNPSGAWTVCVRDAQGSREETFDSVAVCSGLHQNPHTPDLPGRESFSGETMHSAQYRRPSQVMGKRVLIVGAGESGADVAAEVAANAAETVLSLRRGVAVVPRTRLGRPRDHLTTRLLHSPAHWIFQTRNPADDAKRRVYRRVFLPFLFVDKALQWTGRFFWEYPPLLRASSFAAVRVNFRVHRLIRGLLATSGGTLFEQFRTKSADFVRAMAEGRCHCAPGVDRFDGARVLLQDGSELRPDLVIFCTGFQTRIPFLDQAVAEAPRFLHAFVPEVGPDLAFIGFLRPAVGAIPPLAELQARWFAQIQSGRLKLPPLEDMHQSIQYWQQFRSHFFRAVQGRLGSLVEFAPFCDELASRVGCKPTWSEVRKESRRFQHRFLAGPFVAAQYRLVGPHAKPEIARSVIENLPVMHPWPDRLNLRMRWLLSRLLHRVAGQDYAPKLELEP